jgi:hypothetical protein
MNVFLTTVFLLGGDEEKPTFDDFELRRRQQQQPNHVAFSGGGQRLDGKALKNQDPAQSGEGGGASSSPGARVARKPRAAKGAVPAKQSRYKAFSGAGNSMG